MLYAALLAAGIVSAEPAFEPYWGLREFGLVAGASAGTSFLGSGPRWAGSPLVGVSVETGWEHARLWFGFESYPTYTFVWDAPVYGYEFLMQTVGLMGGGDTLRAGPWLTVGFAAGGWGLRALLTPHWPNRDRNHGLELRAAQMMGEHYQLTVGWHHSWVPRTWDDQAKPLSHPEDFELDEP